MDWRSVGLGKGGCRTQKAFGRAGLVGFRSGSRLQWNWAKGPSSPALGHTGQAGRVAPGADPRSPFTGANWKCCGPMAKGEHFDREPKISVDVLCEGLSTPGRCSDVEVVDEDYEVVILWSGSCEA